MKTLLGSIHLSHNYAVIFLPIKPTPVSGIVPNAKKYVFFPIEAGKIDTGYPHDGRADNAAYRHDRRADKRRYPHDREIDIKML